MTKRNNGRRERYKALTEAERIARNNHFTWLEAVEEFTERIETKRLNKQRRMEARKQLNKQRRNGSR